MDYIKKEEIILPRLGKKEQLAGKAPWIPPLVALPCCLSSVLVGSPSRVLLAFLIFSNWQIASFFDDNRSFYTAVSTWKNFLARFGDPGWFVTQLLVFFLLREEAAPLERAREPSSLTPETGREFFPLSLRQKKNCDLSSTLFFSAGRTFLTNTCEELNCRAIMTAQNLPSIYQA